MSFIKLGELIEISKVENSDSCIPAVNAEILENFKKFATNLKKIAPRAEDFLYFSAVMMHAAEAAGINDDGTPKLNIKGEQVQVGWDKTGGTWRWKSNDSNIKPYKNCFLPGTKILMEDCSSKNIEDIVPGDKVITHTGKVKKVLRTFITPHNDKVVRIKVKNNQDLICTDNHPLYHVNLNEKTSYKFSKASELSVGDLLISPVIHQTIDNNLNSKQNYCLHDILEITEENYSGDVYNFEVEDDHSYVANGLVVSNCNGDIFPEEELVKAHKKWVGKPLCIDHKSSSVDHVRGFIVDTYYDRNLKRVIALCALDKAGYPQLARQVATGVSSCVSMGTAVGRAICSDCARVARAEQDFCDHMRKKSGYGEINVDLNPIELSIVVNGADPRANIKHIIAAANTLNNYLDTKNNELNKFAEKHFSATLSINDSSGSDNSGTTININSKDLNEFKADVEDAFRKLEDINMSANFSEKDTNDLAFNQSSGTIAMDETVLPNTDSVLSPPHDRYASTEDRHQSIDELRKVTATIEEKLSIMKTSLDKLINSSKSTQEENMSGSKEISKKGYYQGTEEPTPGQAKYPKDPLNESAREEDKHMVGQSPFPGVGSVDGLHASPGSVNPSDELERKKMLARAEAEERALKRSAYVKAAKEALETKSYWLGGGGVNEPTPGKQKYPVDKLEYDLREKEDKQMVGQKPFPGVGSVDGLHPSPESADQKDELKRKELLQRASLRAKFVKAANNNGTQNLGQSAWEVYLGDKLLLTASVDALTGGRANTLYSGIATKEFGASLIDKVKTYGADKVRASLVKSAQDVGAPAEAPPVGDMSGQPASVPAPAPQTEPMVQEPVAQEVSNKDTGKSGDPKDEAIELAEKARDVTSDLVEAVRALTGEQAEMGADTGVMATASSETFSTANMNHLRRELNTELTHAMKEAIANLNDHQQELEMIAGMCDKGAVTDANSELFGSIVDDALTEAKSAIADGFGLMTAFVKYARGTNAIVKRAQIEAELGKLSDEEQMNTPTGHEDDLMNLINDNDSELDEVKNMMDEGEESENHEDTEDLEGLNLVDDNDLMAKPEELKDLNLKPGTKVEVTAASLATLESRAALRAKLAADALGKEDDGSLRDMSKEKFSDMLEEANRLADGQTQLDVKPSGNLGNVETLSEQNRAMMDLAKAPPKVRKEAEAIHRLISEGKLDSSDLDALVAEGLDKDAVAYYKKYFGQVDGGGEFASELVKEHAKAELEKELNTFKVKMARAYELTYDMVDRGLVSNDREVISAHVEELMSFNEANFETLKKVVARHAPTMRKEAGRMPQVGMLHSDTGTEASIGDDWSALSAAFAKNSNRTF